MSTTNVFITGANRGVGHALVQTYLARPNHIVIGSVRDIAAARSNGLEDLSAASGSKLVLVKIESTSFADPTRAVAELESWGITRLDIVIANAAIAGGKVAAAAEGDAEDFANILAINAVAPLALFAATKPLLDRATTPKWVSISSAVASLANHEAMFMNMGGRPMGFGYGASKATLNHLSLNIHSENPKLTAIAVDPGFLDTDMGTRGAKHFGMEKPPHSAADNAKAIVKLIDAATRETHSGKFLTFDGDEVPW
ncbi:unnamed protein product [Clonostachys rhizophaga]|uniref:Uncharacterized protein n=1 Tax=Clonostachys rhizophaga TaxID=160324 RepID=A0A9N9VKJ0_9HYPO|nr:unnamed protein product [Clonostachys rhizophaga]